MLKLVACSSVAAIAAATTLAAWKAKRVVGSESGSEEEISRGGINAFHCASTSPSSRKPPSCGWESRRRRSGGWPPACAVSRQSLLELQESWPALEEAVEGGRALIQRVMVEQGVPGAVMAVMKDGRLVWSEGAGLADVENGTPCTPDSVMRIASISKSLAAVGLMQLYQRNLLDLDAPIQQYLPEFPRKEFEGEEVEISCRLLLSHRAGIRHYQKNQGETRDEFDHEEYYIKSHYSSVGDSIKLFAADDLACKPGSQFFYSTHGWTLLSGVMEKVSGESFLEYMRKNVLNPLGMSSTMPELNDKIIYGRAKHYVCRKGLLRNAPYVDLSYKWAGGGYISNAEDLTKFGSAVLASWQAGSRLGHRQEEEEGLLSPATASLMLTPAVTDVNNNNNNNKDPPHSFPPPVGYGMGWFVQRAKKGPLQGKDHPLVFSHTGGAVGACSVLTIIPTTTTTTETTTTIRRTTPHDDADVDAAVAMPAPMTTEMERRREEVPSGVVVAVIFNLQEVEGVFKLGQQVAQLFHDI